ncbi:MAG: T9SS type A sorting domain-containing protein, partial [Saprospiraceae bacterium]|nr:T9SS type A sorting domain-containing protein [Saprospiraceae bacterium]
SFHEDASVTGIELQDTVRYTLLIPGFRYKVSYGRIAITVSNLGVNPLHFVTIQFDEPICPFICEGRYQLRWEFGGLNIPAGGSEVLEIDNIELGCLPFIPSEICLWTSGPNNAPDADLSNDLYCAPIELITYSDVPDASDDVIVYPNPAAGILYVALPESSRFPATVNLYNASGQIVLTQAANATDVRLDISHCPSGTYFLELHSGRDRMVQKVVVSSRH